MQLSVTVVSEPHTGTRLSLLRDYLIPFPYIVLIHKNTPYTAFIILRPYSPHKP